MSMRISFELSDRDLKHFKKIANSARSAARDATEAQVVKAAEDLLKEVKAAKTPDFISERLESLRSMIDMLQDEEWGLGKPERENVLSALAYFCDPEDLIPDATPGFGFLDDAVMVELIVRELKHEIEAYEDFCNYREREKKRSGKNTDRAEWLHNKRKELHSRMRRRKRSGRSGTTPRFRMF